MVAAEVSAEIFRQIKKDTEGVTSVALWASGVSGVSFGQPMYERNRIDKKIYCKNSLVLAH